MDVDASTIMNIDGDGATANSFQRLGVWHLLWSSSISIFDDPLYLTWHTMA
jgi:hypothetical protein